MVMKTRYIPNGKKEGGEMDKRRRENRGSYTYFGSGPTELPGLCPNEFQACIFMCGVSFMRLLLYTRYLS